MEYLVQSRVDTLKLDVICDVLDLEVRVLAIIARDASKRLYSIEIDNNHQPSRLLHIDAREELAVLASDAKISEGLQRARTLYGNDGTECCWTSTQVINESSVVHRNRSRDDVVGQVAPEEIDMASLVFKDSQGILYCTKLETLNGNHNVLEGVCRSKVAEYVSALSQSGANEVHLGNISVRYVVEHAIVPLTRWW